MNKLIISYCNTFDNTKLSRENSDRINIPVEYLSKYFRLYNSKSYNYTKEEIIRLIKTIYSIEYINKFKNITFETTLCNTCSYENSIENEYCEMCDSIMSNTYNKVLDNDNDTIITQNTFNQLFESIKVIKNIIDTYDNYNYYYALIRPPGHHASCNHHEGYCIVNNAYLLSRNLIDNHKCKKIIIFDWDLHHGNGTSKFVKENIKNDVYFISMHGYEKNFYPQTGDEKENNDFIFNIPLDRNTNDEQYIEKFYKISVPYINYIIDDIDCIIISNGLDGHCDDPCNFMKLTNKSYVEITKYFISTNKKLIFLLEGGYNPNTISIVSYDIISLLL